jgi:hypothetical protein
MPATMPRDSRATGALLRRPTSTSPNRENEARDRVVVMTGSTQAQPSRPRVDAEKWIPLRA